MISILDSGVQMGRDGQIQYIWFFIRDHDGQDFFRSVALKELAAVPVSMREDYDLLQKQWAAVRGLYNAQADYIYSAAGIFTPQHVGIVQYYGGAGAGNTRDESAQIALRNLAAVEGTLANYAQSRLAFPNPLWIEWYLDFITHRSSNIMALLGHPDPRDTRRGMGKDGEIPDNTGDDLATEQNELLFRGLAKLREDFIFQVTSERIGRKRLAEGLTRVAQLTSNIASRQRGNLSIGFSLTLPVAMSLSNAISGGRSASDSKAHSTGENVSHGWGDSRTDSTSHTDSRSTTVGGSETHSYGTSSSVGTNHSVSHGRTVSSSHTEGGSVTSTSTQSFGTSQSTGATHSDSVGQSAGASFGSSSQTSQSASQNWSNGASQSASQGVGQTNTLSGNVGGNVGASGNLQPEVAGSQIGSVGMNAGVNASVGASQSNSASASSSVGTSASVGGGSSVGSTEGTNSSMSVGVSSGQTDGVSGSQGSSQGQTFSTSVSSMSSDSSGVAISNSVSNGVSRSSGVSEGVAYSRSWASTQGSADSYGTAKGVSENWGQGHSEGDAVGQALGRAVNTGWGGGMSAGIAPGISIGRSWVAEDDLAIRLTELLRQFEGQLNVASSEGGFMTTAAIFTSSERGEAAARALVPQAFHGAGVPTPVLTVQPQGFEAQDFRDHALAFLHYPGTEEDDPFGGYLFTRFSTLLTPGQNAAYTAPGLFEEGSAMTVMAPIPRGIAFYPNMPGDVLIGHQYSPETADLTTAPVHLDESRLMHTLFAGDTGWGKSVAAIMMAYESTLKWRTRTVVLDFGAGWRQLLNAPGLEGHVEILQLWPDAVRPFRWNPLQIGREINPETQWRAFADIFGSIAKLGVKRQKQELLQALRDVYIRAGVLADDPEVRRDRELGRVNGAAESKIAGAPDGTPLGNLDRDQRQAIAVDRSSRVGLADLYAEVEDKLSKVSVRDTMLQGVLEGILFRLNPLVQGAASMQFAAGPSATPLEDLSRPWGITVIEGGAFLDDFGKAFLLGWAGWHLYTDMVARRAHGHSNDEPLLQIFFEEANKIFGGVADSAGDDESGGVPTSQRFADMFRDARKYNCRLHVISQAPSLVPQDIISSCNNLVIGFLKAPKDKDIALSAMARSEKGFRDEEWRRFITNENIGMALGRFPYATSRELQQPILFKPLMLSVPEPTDGEIAERLGRILL